MISSPNGILAVVELSCLVPQRGCCIPVPIDPWTNHIQTSTSCSVGRGAVASLFCDPGTGIQWTNGY